MDVAVGAALSRLREASPQVATVPFRAQNRRIPGEVYWRQNQTLPPNTRPEGQSAFAAHNVDQANPAGPPRVALSLWGTPAPVHAAPEASD